MWQRFDKYFGLLGRTASSETCTSYRATSKRYENLLIRVIFVVVVVVFVVFCLFVCLFFIFFLYHHQAEPSALGQMMSVFQSWSCSVTLEISYLGEPVDQYLLPVLFPWLVAIVVLVTAFSFYFFYIAFVFSCNIKLSI